jgi:hypothetical protein
VVGDGLRVADRRWAEVGWQGVGELKDLSTVTVI